ncbi:unnamed protein product [Haemonchus placei]|uniref:BAG domain-containing protein n=1 Tax=Haemonchus placei TaxID=6290 RepID=A0A0N4WPX5_HAEPC|nr:unnamed protein product [Haemonchus placei]
MFVLCLLCHVFGETEMSSYLDAKQFHAVILRDTTANVTDARRNRALKERLETIYKLIVQMEKEEKEHTKMLNNSQWSRELVVHQPIFEASWEIVRRLDATSESARPDTQ